jgi:hypothetical protein
VAALLNCLSPFVFCEMNGGCPTGIASHQNIYRRGKQRIPTTLPFYAVALLFFALTISCSASLFGHSRSQVGCWVEESPSNHNTEAIYGVNIEKSNHLRQLFMFRQLLSHDPSTPVLHQPLLRQEWTETEHPLRTDKWEFTIRWTKGEETHELHQVNGTHQLFRMDLHRCGYVRVWNKELLCASSSQTPIAMGRWFKRPWGVSVIIRPLETSISPSPAGDDSSSSLSISQDHEWVLFASYFHKNPFRKQPKLKQGTILLQRPKLWLFEEEEGADSNKSMQTRCLRWKRHQQWFRPVVGKFSAFGVDAQE